MVSLSYYPDYFSVEDILATQERIPCKFVQNVTRMGVLNPSTDEKDLKAGTELDLPLWLVQDIAIGRQPIVTAELPKVYRESYREILKADATAVDLHKFNWYFYEVGSYLKRIDRRGNLQATLRDTFATRFRLIMDLANNAESDPNLQQKLDMTERRLFKESYNARVKLNAWLTESGIPLQAANMVTNHRKRKRVDDDIFL